MRQKQRILFITGVYLMSCSAPAPEPEGKPNPVRTADGLSLDPATGVPYALTFQHPIRGFDGSDYGFSFGSVNYGWCLSTRADGSCASYGAHLARDTIVSRTPVGTEVLAPADGIVRITTDRRFAGYGSDHSANPSYTGCLIVLEHLLRNGQAVTTLLGHIRCESDRTYDPAIRVGNPPRGTLVSRGQYVAHVADYWHGRGASTNWHHLHWGMRKGRFTGGTSDSSLQPFVSGYAPQSAFTTDATGARVHPTWMDPLRVVEANDDPASTAAAGVRQHPSGTVLQDPHGEYWLVHTDAKIRQIPSDVFVADRYDPESVITVSESEVDCYRTGSNLSEQGHVTLYVRPGTNTVVMAYDDAWDRYDVIRWEALLSWGFGESDLRDPPSASFYERSYYDRGFRLLRPGALVKADNASEVAIVTAEQTRVPIASGDVFEAAGFRWERVLSLPASVLDAVAGPRSSDLFTWDDLHQCASPPGCPGGAASCGGGGEPEQESSPEDSEPEEASDPIPEESEPSEPDPSEPEPENPPPDAFHLSYVSPVNGEISLQGWWEQSDGSTRAWGPIPCADMDPSDDRLDCDLSVPSGAPQFEFQLYLPDGTYWGDQSCDSGGCDDPLGSATLTKQGMTVSYTFVPNPDGAPYYNGRVAPVP